MKQIYDDLRLVLLLVVMFAFSSLFGQNSNIQRDTANYPFWTLMMQDPNANFYATQSAFYKYWADRNTKVKGNGYKVFKRWEYINEFRVLPDGRLQPPGYVKRIFDEYSRNLAGNELKNATCDWSLIGPTTLPANATVQPNGMGRINAIAFHPTDANIIYIGAPAGGIWKTIDGGATWANLSSDMPTLGVSAILIHPSNPDIIYIGSGDRDSDDAPGLGVFKSTNGGTSWVQMNNSMGNARVGALAMSPADPDIIIAATNMGLYRTTNGGTTWSQRLTSSLWKDVKFKPGDANIVYAAWGGVLYRSTDAGLNWSSVTLPATGSRIVIGVSPDDPSYVYLAQTNSSDETFEGLMRSTDSGLTFTIMSNTPNIYGYACDGSDASSQAWYDLCINVDPNNANILYVGGINIWKSTDGGANWAISSHWVGSSFSDPCGGAASVHADQHALEWSPLNGRLYCGNDGGIYWTSDGGTIWNDISSGIEIAQVYKIGQSATNQSLVLHGYQDNGTSLSNNSSFTTVGGGDGFECIIDYSDTNVRFITFPNGDMSRSMGGGYSTVAGDGSNGITESGAFSSPFMQHVTDPNTLFGGYKNVWRTNNAKASPASSVTWSAISTGESSTCRVIQQSTADPNVLYAVRSGSLQRTDNANAAAASVSWTSCSLPGGFTPTDIETHPTNPNIVYATAGNGVYKSIDKGANWTDISGNLPALFTNCLVYDKNTNEGLYVGNQTGIWYKDANMATWMTYAASFPIVDVREIEIYYDAANRNNERVKAATYGRGAWENKLLSSPPVLNCASVTAVNLTPDAAGCTNNTDLTAPVAVDNCDGNIAGVGARSDAAPMNDPWPLGATTVTWTFTDGVGSSHQCIQTVTVTNNLSPTITGPTSVCSGGSVTLDAGAGYSSYAWSNGGGSGQTATYNNVTSAATYSVTVGDANGCTGSDTHDVSISLNLSPTITGPTSVCSGGSVTLDAGAGYSSYSWSNGGGSGQTAT
ncbi:MAG: hypothetical protein HUU34_18335 [Saprospiraceae bacterium]|nr:hypothetical protein [Saprospiraceae bacterium]